LSPRGDFRGVTIVLEKTTNKISHKTLSPRGNFRGVTDIIKKRINKTALKINEN